MLLLRRRGSKNRSRPQPLWIHLGTTVWVNPSTKNTWGHTCNTCTRLWTLKGTRQCGPGRQIRYILVCCYLTESFYCQHATQPPPRFQFFDDTDWSINRNDSQPYFGFTISLQHKGYMNHISIAVVLWSSLACQAWHWSVVIWPMWRLPTRPRRWGTRGWGRWGGQNCLINGASQWLISGLSYKTNHHGDIWGYWMGYHGTY